MVPLVIPARKLAYVQIQTVALVAISLTHDDQTDSPSNPSQPFVSIEQRTFFSKCDTRPCRCVAYQNRAAPDGMHVGSKMDP
jgi:hypothetical protein